MIQEDQSNEQDTSTLLSLQIKSCEIFEVSWPSEFMLGPSLLGGFITKSTLNVVTNFILSKLSIDCKLHV
jgi:hypothetical protein